MMGAIHCTPTAILPNLVMGVLYHGLCVLARQYIVWLFERPDIFDLCQFVYWCLSCSLVFSRLSCQLLYHLEALQLSFFFFSPPFFSTLSKGYATFFPLLRSRNVCHAF